MQRATQGGVFCPGFLKGIVVLLTNDDSMPPAYRQFTFSRTDFIVLRKAVNIRKIPVKFKVYGCMTDNVNSPHKWEADYERKTDGWDLGGPTPRSNALLQADSSSRDE